MLPEDAAIGRMLPGHRARAQLLPCILALGSLGSIFTRVWLLPCRSMPPNHMPTCL